jgi:site-specific recombinase XerD
MDHFKRSKGLERRKYMSEPEVRKLRRAVEDRAVADLAKGRTTWPRFWMVMDLATGTGMRVSEIGRLRIGHLFLGHQEPRIYVSRGKGGRSRDVFIAKALRKHLLDFISWKKLVGEPVGSDDPLLLSSHRRPYGTRMLQYAFKCALAAAGLRLDYSVHACRHSYGTFLYQRTKNLRMVQRQLGHSAITTTTIYTDVPVDEIVQGVNGLFQEQGG